MLSFVLGFHELHVRVCHNDFRSTAMFRFCGGREVLCARGSGKCEDHQRDKNARRFGTAARNIDLASDSFFAAIVTFSKCTGTGSVESEAILLHTSSGNAAQVKAVKPKT
jgi:hypothetical protein